MSVSNKIGLLLIDIDEIFAMQSSEFTKSLYFWSIWEKLQQTSKKIDFSPINGFLKIKIYILKLKRAESHRSEQDISDETIRFWNFPFSRKLWLKKTANIDEISTMLKSAQFPNYKSYRS